MTSPLPQRTTPPTRSARSVDRNACSAQEVTAVLVTHRARPRRTVTSRITAVSRAAARRFHRIALTMTSASIQVHELASRFAYDSVANWPSFVTSRKLQVRRDDVSSVDFRKLSLILSFALHAIAADYQSINGSDHRTVTDLSSSK